MNFKVGDKVRRTKPSNYPDKFGEIGHEYTVLGVIYEDSIVVIPDGPAADASCFVWVPKTGDLVEIKLYENAEWELRIFLATYDGRHYCKQINSVGAVGAYDKIRKPRPKHIVTIDGKDIELSEESFNALKKQLVQGMWER